MQTTAEQPSIFSPESAENIPRELKQLSRWVCWGYQPGDKSPRTLSGALASSTNPATWSTFSAASVVALSCYGGVGFVLTDDDDILGIDIDHCVCPNGALTPAAENIVHRLNSYTEVSPSGSGLHIFIRGKKNIKACRFTSGLEIYETSRYLTVTGNRIHGEAVECRQEALEAVMRAYLPAPEAKAAPAPIQDASAAPTHDAPPPHSDEEVIAAIRRARNSAKFAKLFDDGDLSIADDDPSKADSILTALLAFYTQDVAQLDNLMQQSALMRDKWCRADGTYGTYGLRTISAVLARAVGDDTYSWPPGSGGTKPTLANYTEGDPDDPKKHPPKFARDIVEVVADVLRLDLFRAASGVLFVDHDGEPRWLTTSTEFFATLSSHCRLQWASRGQDSSGIRFVMQDELFAAVKWAAPQYLNVESYPHEPQLPDRCYLWQAPTDYKPTGAAFKKLLSLWDSHKTEEAKVLACAMFMTPFWGGGAGARPAFFVCADKLGVGKSTLAHTVGALSGGFISIDSGATDHADLLPRLLSPKGRGKRVAVFDNVKHEMKSALLEGIVTSPVISGRQLYAGEGERPNDLTWIVTANIPSLSGDWASRAFFVDLVTPTFSSTWEDTMLGLLKNHGDEIIVDILDMLKGAPLAPGVLGTAGGRWSAWVAHVLYAACRFQASGDPMSLLWACLKATGSDRRKHDSQKKDADSVWETLLDLSKSDPGRLLQPSPQAGLIAFRGKNVDEILHQASGNKLMGRNKAISHLRRLISAGLLPLHEETATRLWVENKP